MTKYSRKERDRASSQIRTCLKNGLTYHKAAKQVSKTSPIVLLSLRRMAYRIAVQEGFYTPKGIQHVTDTEHGSLLDRCATRLERKGYSVIREQNAIRRFVEARGSKGTPDLVATKPGHTVLVEVVERSKGAATFVDQVERFSAICSVIVVLPIDLSKVEVWGSSDLEVE